MTLPKPKREKCRPYLDWLHDKPSIFVKHPDFSINYESEPHHFTARGHGATSSKCPDSRALPLSAAEHREVHQVGRDTFLRRHDITEDIIEAYIIYYNQLWETRHEKTKI